MLDSQVKQLQKKKKKKHTLIIQFSKDPYPSYTTVVLLHREAKWCCDKAPVSSFQELGRL